MDISGQLDSAHGSGAPSVHITAAGRNYTVDTASMEQTNDATRVVRKVRRAASASGLQLLCIHGDDVAACVCVCVCVCVWGGGGRINVCM